MLRNTIQKIRINYTDFRKLGNLDDCLYLTRRNNDKHFVTDIAAFFLEWYRKSDVTWEEKLFNYTTFA